MVFEKMNSSPNRTKKSKCTCHCEGAEFRVCLYLCKQFFSLNCWKTIFLRIWLYRRRHILITIIQLLAPPMILLCLLNYHGAIYSDSNKVDKWTEPKPLEEHDLISKICGLDCDEAGTYVIGYYPESEFSTKMVKYMTTYFQDNTPNSIKFVPGDNENDLVKFTIIHHLLEKQNLYLGGLSFNHDKTTGASQPPKQLSVTIRMAHNIPFEIKPSTLFDYSVNKPEKYYGFLGTQLGLFRAYEKIVYESMTLLNDTSKTKTFEEHRDNPLKLKVQSFPIPPHIEYKRNDGHDCDSDLILRSTLVLGMTVTVFSIILAPISEKESGFKLYTRLMGMPRWAYWMSWILNEVLVQFVVMIIQCFLLYANLNGKTGPMVKQGNISVWIVLLLLYTLASTSFLAFIASFFKRGVTATYTGATIWLLTFYFLDLYGATYLVNSARFAKVTMCFIPNGGLIWALTLLTADIRGNSDFDWSEDSVHPFDSGDVSLFRVMVIFVFDFVLYFVLTLYIDNIRPGDPEFRQPWNYFFQGIRCRCEDRKVTSAKRPSLMDNLETVILRARLEGAFNVHIADSVVHFQQISKSFDGQHAVDDVNLRIFDGQVTVILGHSGCGKSTLFRLLCGEYYPTSGTAFVKHVDVRRNSYDVQQKLSICLQKNLFSSDLTVMDHMILVGQIKGLGYCESKKKAEKLLGLFELESQSNYFPEQLISYEKRRLCIALSLIGENKIILLDEPTAGLNIDMKRHIWDILKKFYDQKTIIVISSDIDEAYYLGDRIAIMSKGKILAAGSRQLLQKIFETGYHLQLNLSPSAERSDVLRFIQDSAKTSADLLDNHSHKISRRMAIVMCMVDTDQQDMIINSINSCNNYQTNMFDENVWDVSEHFAESVHFLETVVEDDNETVKESESVLVNDRIMVLQLRINEDMNLSRLFTALEQETISVKVGIIDYKLKLFDLETAFEAIDKKTDVEDMEQEYTTDVAVNMVPLQTWEEFNTFGFFFHLQQLRGLLMKRFWWIIGHWQNTIMVQLLIPILVIIITVKTADVLYYSGYGKDIVAINYDPKNMFSRSRILFKNNPAEESSMVKEYSEYYKTEIQNHFGFDATIPLEKLSFREYQENTANIKKRYSLGVHIENASVTAVFSALGFHAAPVSLGLILNASLQYDFPDSGYSILFNSFPIEPSTNKLLKYYKNFKDPYQIDPAFCYAVMLGFSFFIFVSNFVGQPLSERLSWLKSLQTNTSAGSFKYWISFFVVDFSLSVVVGATLLFCIAFIAKAPIFRDVYFAEHFILYWCLSSYTSIMLSYIFSFHLRRSNTGYYAMLSCNQCAGLFTFVLSRTISNPLQQQIARTVFRIFQPYLVVSGFHYIFVHAAENAMCSLLSEEVKECICSENKLYSMNVSTVDKRCCRQSCLRENDCSGAAYYFEWSNLKNYIHTDNNLTWDYVCLLSHAVVLTIALVLTEQGLQKQFRRSFNLKGQRKKMSTTVEKECELTEDSLALEPKERQKELFIMKEIYKFSKGHELTNINLVAQPGQLLEICGPSCSGKTTLFHILARFRSTNCGNVYYDGESLVSWRFYRFLSKIGYCPSNDVSLAKLTGLQMMKLFGRLRGIPESDLNARVNEWLRDLDLEKRANQRCEMYNHSMKKKLAFALAVIGDPKVIILDNPFKDINPSSRFLIASRIKDLLALNRIIIATTDDVTDFECSRKSAFLVNGKLEFVVHPRGEEIFGNRIKGYALTIKLVVDPANVTFNDYADLKIRILKSFPESELVEEQQYVYKYHVEDKQYKWSALFGMMESIKTDFTQIVEEYTIRELDLEDLYNRYAIKQRKYRKTPESWDVFCTTYC